MLSAMVLKASVVGFYDSMGDASVDFCLKQTHMETMFVSTAYLAKILNLKEQGMATYVRNIVMFDTDDQTLALKERAQNEFSMRVFTLDEVREAGRNS